jgi:hypothetical protein
MKSKINSVLEEIIAEPAIIQIPTREVLVGGPLSFPTEILSLSEIKEEELSVGPFKGIEDEEIKEMLLSIKLIHLKMDKLISDLEEMKRTYLEVRLNEN